MSKEEHARIEREQHPMLYMNTTDNGGYVLSAEDRKFLEDYVDTLFPAEHVAALNQEIEGISKLYDQALRREGENYAKCIAADERYQDREDVIRDLVGKWEDRQSENFDEVRQEMIDEMKSIAGVKTYKKPTTRDTER